MQCQFSDAEPGHISHIGHVRAGSHQVSLIHAVACYNHSTNTTIGCSCDPRTKPCCPSLYSYSHDKGYPSAYTHLYIKCSTCATPTVRPCPYSTKMPDHRDVTEEVTAPGSMNDVLDPEYAWTILAICALSCWTLSLDKHYEVAHPESGPQLSHLTLIPNFSYHMLKRGMLYYLLMFWLLRFSFYASPFPVLIKLYCPLSHMRLVINGFRQVLAYEINILN